MEALKDFLANYEPIEVILMTFFMIAFSYTFGLYTYEWVRRKTKAGRMINHSKRSKNRFNEW